MDSNCYHHRNSRDKKTLGGMIHASSYEEAARRAVNGLTIQKSPSGRLIFANKKGEEVWVYLSVHPEHTPEGAVIQAEMDRAREARIAELQAKFL